MTRTLIIRDGDNEYGGQIGTIRSTRLGYEDHGILTADINVEWPGGGVGVGGFCLDQSTGSPNYDREGTAYGLDHLIRILEVVGVSKWESLVGQKVIVLFDGVGNTLGSRSVGLAHATDEKKVLVLKDHADFWREKEEA